MSSFAAPVFVPENERDRPAAQPALVSKVYDPAELSIVPNMSRRVVSWISTEVVDHVGDVVLAEGVDFRSAFLDKNPVVMAHHDYGKWPVGLATEVKLKRGNGFNGLLGIMNFDEDPDAVRVFGMVERKLVRGQSIGFVPPLDFDYPKDWGPPTADELKRHPDWKDARRIIRRCVLVEWSFVPIPMNRESLVIAVQKGLEIPTHWRGAAEKLMNPNPAETKTETTPPAPEQKTAEPPATAPAADDAEAKGASADKEAMCKAVCKAAGQVNHSGVRGHAYYHHGMKAAHHDMADEDDGDGKYDQADDIKAHYMKACKGLKLVTVGVACGHPGKGYEKVFPPKGSKGADEGVTTKTSDPAPPSDNEPLRAGHAVKFVDGRKGVGQVISLHADGDLVPNVADDVMGTADEPACLVRMFKRLGDGFVPTELYIGHPAKGLERIGELKPPTPASRKAAKATAASLPPLPAPAALPPLTADFVAKTFAEAFSPEAIRAGIAKAEAKATGKITF